MKKVLLVLMMAIAFMANASNPDNGRGVGTHWTFNPYTQYNLTLTGVMYLDGESLQNNSWSEYLEIGAFCGNECRGSFIAENLSLPFFQGYAYQMQIYSNVQSGEQITFRVWDHQAGEELEVSCTSPITFVADAGFGNLMSPFNLTFQTSFDITVSANPTQGGTVSGGGSYFPGQTCTLTATSNAAYDFVNWTKDGTVVSTNATYSFIVNENANYVANFTLKTYTITATANPSQGGSVSNANNSFVDFETGDLTSYGFDNTISSYPWVLTSPGYNGSFCMMSGNGGVASSTSAIEITVEFIQDGSISFLGGCWGEGTSTIWDKCRFFIDNNQQFSYGALQIWNTYSFDVTAGTHTFRWSYDKDGSVNPTGDCFMVDDIEFNGAATGGPGIYTHGSICTLTAIPNQGYDFVNWTKNGVVVSTNPTYSFTVTENAAYVANFTLKTYNITTSASPVDGGELTGAGTYTHGQTCTLTATAGLAYIFVNWTKNGIEVSTDATYSFVVTEAGAYVANFTLKTYNITTSANPTEGGTVSEGGTYTHGSTCTLTATANEGYYFVNWTKNGGVVSTNATYSFTVTEAGAYVANFAPSYHWEVNYHQFIDNMSVTAIIKIDGVEQATNTLELGAFCGEECRGREKLVYIPMFDRYLLFLTLYGENGDVNNFRLYDHEIGAESDKVCVETITFVADGTLGQMDDPFVFNFGYIQFSDFLQGYNWWSTYLEQENMNGLEMLQTGLGSNGISIRSQSNGYTDYYAGYGWYGSLTSITNEDSYRIITNAPCTVNMVGTIADPADHPITIGHGWSWIGYVLSYPLDVTTALSGFEASAGDKLKTQQGYADFYPGYGWYGSLTTFTPGMGVMYYSSGYQSITFTYPDNAKGGELKANITPENNHWVPNTYAYPDNMTIMAVVELDGTEIASDNYELAAFANGECRGSVKLVYAEPLHRYVAFLTVAGDEVTNLNFALYDANTDKECFATEESLNFSVNTHVGNPDEPFIIRFRGTTALDEFANSVQVYPNPVSCGECFSIGMSGDVKNLVRVEVVNAMGVVVETVHAPSVQTLTAPNAPGIYTLRFTKEGEGTTVRKLIVK